MPPLHHSSMSAAIWGVLYGGPAAIARFQGTGVGCLAWGPSLI
jgi:hypothetical protein